MLRSTLVLVFTLVAALPGAAQSIRSGPAIVIDQLPPHGEAGTLRGRVIGVDPMQHEVAPILHVEGAGWFSKPTRDQRTVPLARDGRFHLDVPVNGLDHFAAHYFVALVRAGTSPPLVEGGSSLPTSPDFLATDVEVRYGRTLHFAGHTWGVKEAPLPVGPGANRFSAAPDAVFVDAAGRLHLSVREVGGNWWSTEVVLLDGEGQGRFWFTTASSPDALDPNVTAGMFTWDPFGGADPVTANPNREIDFEDSRWGDAGRPECSQFVVQPWDRPDHLVRYSIPPLVPGDRVTRELQWGPERLRFFTFRGADPPGRHDLADRIAHWTFRHDPAAGRHVPTGGRAQWRLNLWLNQPSGTASGADVEVVIEDFDVRWRE